MDPAGNAPELEDLRAELHRLRVQLTLVELLYLRLVALRSRRLDCPEQERELAPEALRLEAELARASEELGRLGWSVVDRGPDQFNPHQN